MIFDHVKKCLFLSEFGRAQIDFFRYFLRQKHAVLASIGEISLCHDVVAVALRCPPTTSETRVGQHLVRKSPPLLSHIRTTCRWCDESHHIYAEKTHHVGLHSLSLEREEVV